MSFLALRILVSPIDILLLISFISLTLRPTSFSKAIISFCAMTTSCLIASKRSFLYFFSFCKELIHLTFVRLSGKVFKKSFLGTLALRTTNIWIALSLDRISLRPALAIDASSSNIFGLNFKNWKISPSFSYSALASLELLPLPSTTFNVLLYCLFKFVILLWTSSISGPVGFSSSSSSAFALSLPGPAEGTSSISSKKPVSKSLIFLSPSLTIWKNSSTCETVVG